MSRAVIVPLVAVSVLWGCGEGPPSERPKVPVVTGPIVEHAEASAGVAFGASTFPCCSTTELTAVVGAFVGLGEALAADDASAASERVGALGSALAALPPETPSAAELVALSGRMAGQDLEGMREEFLDLSVPMLATARDGRSDGGAIRVAVAFCPMKPGRWLQVTDGIKNPYYGASMLTCGVFEAP